MNEQANTQAAWRPSMRIIFRFVFCYLALYCLYALSFIDLVFKAATTGRFSESWYDLFWHRVIPWVGSHILHLATPITIFSNSSGDTTYDNVLILCELFLAAVVTVVWSALDRKRTEYRTLHEWLRLAIRLVLISAMLIYGLDKLIPVQFGSLTLGRLSTRVGDLTPFSLLWTFMAASKPYTMLCGAAEVLAAVLLLVPRFTTLGALIAMADMANVFALDMSYDVPVKLGSLHYLLMAAFLVAPDVQRLLDVLVFNRVAAPRETIPLSSRRGVNRAAQIFLVVEALLFFAVLTREGLKRYAAQNSAVTGVHSALYGDWAIDEFTVSASSSAPLFTAKLASDMSIAPGNDRWSELLIEGDSSALIRLNGGLTDYVTLKLEPSKNTVAIGDEDDENWKCDFVYQKAGDRQLALQGRINGNPVTMKLHRVDGKSILVTRGFHWISEHAY